MEQNYVTVNLCIRDLGLGIRTAKAVYYVHAIILNHYLSQLIDLRCSVLSLF